MSYIALGSLLVASGLLTIATALIVDRTGAALFVFFGACLMLTGGIPLGYNKVIEALKRSCPQERVVKEREVVCTVPMEVIIKDGAAWDFRYPKRPAQAAASE